MQVLFQFAFTTVFGWLATWVFLSTGHAFAPALVHAACNAVGVPPFGEMRRARVCGQPVLVWATAAGVVLFWVLSGELLRPELYGSHVYAGE
jgi:prenyl protein peptidase